MCRHTAFLRVFFVAEFSSVGELQNDAFNTDLFGL